MVVEWINEKLFPFFPEFPQLSARPVKEPPIVLGFFSETVGQVAAAFIVIRETNRRRCVQGILGMNCCSHLEWRVKASWQRRGRSDAMKALHRAWQVFLITQHLWLTCAHKQEGKNHHRQEHTGNVGMRWFEKGSIRTCKMARMEKEGNYSRMRNVQIAPQPATTT